MSDFKEIQVFISCPGDLTPEKDMIIQICSAKNNSLMMRGSNFRFLPLDFRSIIAPMSGRAQQEINDRFSNYDIYIGMLWMRFGSPSGADNPETGKPFESGTEEEFVLARRRYETVGKIGMYLFFKQPRGANTTQETLQLLKVHNFRDKVLPLGWVNSIANIEPNYAFRDTIHHLLEEWVSNVENTEHLAEKQSYLNHLPVETESSGIAFAEVTRFITKAPHLGKALTRSLSSFSNVRNPGFNYFGNTEGESIIELVKTVKRLVVLGNAGSGKSTELGNLAHHYAHSGTPFVPVYQRLNTYVDEDIDNFLPQGWKDVPEGICLVILDGLDEVQPSNFNTLVRKLLQFSGKYPHLRMVISCRTNFYSFPDDTSGGTLGGFEVFFLEDIKTQNLGNYIETAFQSDALNFLKEVRKHELDDMVHQPFFLNLLLLEFSKRGDLDIRKTDLLDHFISSRIALDQTHYHLTVPLKDKEPHITRLLQTVALAMEYLGRNFLSYNELLRLLPDPADVALIKYSTTFKSFETETDKWGFEHNNIQEYLAASALIDREVGEIKLFLSIQGKVIKPSWLNTLFFLMGIIDQEKRQQLIAWILEIDPEVLVKIEPDKVDPETRMEIFRSIFEHYKQQGVWLRSNKFSITELSRFVPVLEGSVYLLEQLNDANNSRVVRLNALLVLKSQKLDVQMLGQAQAALLDFAEKNPDDHYIVHNVAYALSELGVANNQLIKRMMVVFGDRKNQYIRSGLYQLIITAGLVDEYIDYFLEGIGYSREQPDRDPVHLLDEDLLIKAAFTGPLKFKSVVRLLQLFEDSRATRLSGYHDKNDILRPLIDKASALYNDHPELYGIVSSIYVKGRRPSDESVSEIIAGFFHKTGTDLKLFKSLFTTTDLSQYEKGMLYKYVLSTSAIDDVVSSYEKRDLTNKDVLDFYDSVRWFTGPVRKPEEFAYLTEQLNSRTSLLKDRIEIDHGKIRQEKVVRDTALYFSPENFKAVIIQFFDSLGISEIDWDVLWQHNGFDDTDGKGLPEPVFDLLVDFTRNKGKVTLERVLTNMQDDTKFQNYLFRHLKEKISSNSDIVLNDDQIARLKLWVNEQVLLSDVPNAITTDQKNPDRFSYDRTVMVLWYYISHFKIKVDQAKLLDFTLYAEPNHNQEISLDFDVLEELTGKDKVIKRVQHNLQTEISYDGSWKNNALYALKNNISQTYPLILTELGNLGRSSYSRDFVLKKYWEKTEDFNGLATLFVELGHDDLRWSVVDLLSTNIEHKAIVESLLIKILTSPYENDNEKFRASKYLTKVGELSGTAWYLAMLREKAGGSYDFYHEAAYLRSIKDPIFIPELISLLQIANQPEMKVDDFNRLDAYLADALFAIGLVSEKNLKDVRDAVEIFISTNKGIIKDVNFYYPMLDKMEYHFWLAKSQQANIDDAIAEVQKLG